MAVSGSSGDDQNTDQAPTGEDLTRNSPLMTDDPNVGLGADLEDIGVRRGTTRDLGDTTDQGNLAGTMSRVRLPSEDLLGRDAVPGIGNTSGPVGEDDSPGTYMEVEKGAPLPSPYAQRPEVE